MNGDVKPKLKPTVHPFRLDDTVYISAGGTAVELDDPERSIGFLLDQMDGRLSLAELHKVVVDRYPMVTLAEIEDVLAQFDQAHLLEDAAHGPDGLLDEYEQRRWERNIDFLGSFTTMGVSKYLLQHRIRSARVALLGLGGLGSHLLYDLAAVGVMDLRAVEFDRLELSNLNRQILYDEADLGQPKAELASRRIRAFSPRMNVDIREMRLSSLEDVREIVRGREYVICVADRPEMEIIRWVSEACVREGAVLIAGGLDTPRGVYWSMIPGVTGCAECWQRQVARDAPVAHALLEQQRQPGRPQYGGDNSSFVPLVGELAALMLGEFVRLSTGVGPPASAGRLIEVSFGSAPAREAESWTRLDDCPICGLRSPALLTLAGRS